MRIINDKPNDNQVTAPHPVTVKIIYSICGFNYSWEIGETYLDGEKDIREFMKRYVPNAKYIRHEVIK